MSDPTKPEPLTEAEEQECRRLTDEYRGAGYDRHLVMRLFATLDATRAALRDTELRARCHDCDAVLAEHEALEQTFRAVRDQRDAATERASKLEHKLAAEQGYAKSREDLAEGYHTQLHELQRALGTTDHDTATMVRAIAAATERAERAEAERDSALTTARIANEARASYENQLTAATERYTEAEATLDDTVRIANNRQDALEAEVKAATERANTLQQAVLEKRDLLAAQERERGMREAIERGLSRSEDDRYTRRERICDMVAILRAALSASPAPSGGIQVIADPTMPRDEVELRSGVDAVRVKIHRPGT